VSDEIRVKRLWWHSRRGMLELDVILIPFVEEAFQNLAEADQQRYEQLLEEEDTDLFAWFMERVVPENPETARIVEVVLEHARTRKL
jgi:antitoxin CptB